MTTPPSSPVGARPRIELHAEVDGAVQLALQQLGRPLVRSLRIENHGPGVAGQTRLRITVDPAVAHAAEVVLSPIAPGQSQRVDAARLAMPLLLEPLLAQTDRARGSVRIELIGDVDCSPLSAPLEVLPADHWPGMSAPLDLLAAFVTPNSIATAKLLGHMRVVLEKSGRDTALEGYQRRSRERVLELCAGAYGAIGQAGITYANPPADFGRAGQRIRTTDRVVAEAIGTCLDITLAVCAMLEQIGVGAIAVVIDGHAFIGAWLVDEALPATWTDEPTLLRNRVGLGEMVVFDSSLATHSAPFAEAVTAATRMLEERPFLFAVDVVSARKAGIFPIPHRSDDGSIVVAGRGAGGSGAGAQELPALPGTVPRNGRVDGREHGLVESDRLYSYKAKLLDLSLNNRLINQRNRKSLLRLVVDDVAALEDALHGDGGLVLASGGTAESAGDPRQAALEALRKRVLLVDLPESEFFARATELYRTVRTFAEDTGTAPLFLTLGALRWVESAASQVERFAPAVLMPVTLVRDSVRGPFRVRWTGEEPVYNPALLKKLETEFGTTAAGSDRLGSDQAGFDIAGALQVLRSAVRDIPGFEVRGVATIDLLAFAKFTMWADLEQNVAALRASPILRRLLDPGSPALAQPAPFADPQELDDTRLPHEDLSVVDADSTQLAAIWSAVDGNSFVLQGPPGTGKSQTITNLIAQALARNKTVLFVAEKKAALDVVHTRLQRVGLAPFILEAHSDKASRGAVAEQLRAAIDVAGKARQTDWAERSATLGAARARLNEYARRVNRPGPWGESLQQAIGRCVALDAAPVIELETTTALDAASVAAMRDALARMAADAAELGPIARHPWHAFDPPNATPEAVRDVDRSVNALVASHQVLSEAHAAAERALGLNRGGSPLEPTVSLASMLLAVPPISPGILQTRRADYDLPLTQLLAALEQRRAAADSAMTVLQPTVFGEPLWPQWAAAIRRWAGAFFIVRFFMLFSVLRGVRTHAVGSLPRIHALLPIADRVDLVRASNAQIDALAPPLAPVLGPLWRGTDTDPAAVRRAVEFADQYRRVRTALASPGSGASLDALVVEADERFAPGTPGRQSLERLLDAVAAWVMARDAFAVLLRPRTADWIDEQSIVQQRARIEALASSVSLVRDWALYRASARSVAARGAPALVAAVERGEVSPSAIAPAWERALRRGWIEREIGSDPMLTEFRGTRHSELVARFVSLDREAQATARAEVLARLALRLPDPTAPGQMEILRGELNKKRGHMAVRKLFSSVRDVLLRLKPCVLMSPLTVAQHLDPSLPPFDLVIFDEASQIPPWDAVGALARGKQVVVVGDSRQLPPTSFFAKEGGDEADDDELVDTESILDQCIVSGLPEIALGWHYRSRHETLIAFSNHRYYKNRLNIFPSPIGRGPQLGVQWVHVASGHYDRGRSRANRAEAEALVSELAARVLDPGRAQQSIGVVTFSQAQQRCVQDLLDQQRRANTALDQAITQAPEPLFVKNLESVQGDERDVMLFSVGYGPDANQKVSMAFGPLNRNGGERRLNVAVTRARLQLVVFSTLRPEQMNLASTSAQGVHDLKLFLEYASQGPSVLGTSSSVDPSAEYGSPFEEQVDLALRGRGWNTHRQVGVAGYRIDLAVVHPDHPGRYLMAVECDGATYHSAATARDRDRLRQSVLEGLGWRVRRVWSTDWFQGRQRAIIDELVAALEDARRAPVGAALSIAAPVPPSAAEVSPDAHQAAAGAGAAVEPSEPAVSEVDSERRDIASIPMPELVQAVAAVVERAVAIDDEDTYREAARALGFARVGKNVRAALERAADVALNAGLVRREGTTFKSVR